MDARDRELDVRVDGLGLTAQDIDGLFAASDALAGQRRLRAALSDPTVPAEVREQVARKLFTDRLSPAATEVIAAAAGQAKNASGLVAAVERQAVQATFVASRRWTTCRTRSSTSRAVAGDSARRPRSPTR